MIFATIIERIKKTLHRKCKHESEIFSEIVSGKLSEPGEPEREIRIRIRYVKCKKCNQILGLTPAGIVHDPKFDCD